MSRFNSWELFLAVALIVVGALLLAGNLGLILFNWNILWALVLVSFGIWMIGRAMRPSSYMPSHGDAIYGFGDYRPDLTGKEIRRESFSHGVGNSVLDLTRATIPDGQNTMRASQGMGDLRIIVPRDLAVSVNARAGMGAVRVFGERADGIAPHLEFRSDDYVAATCKLDIEASAGLGEVRVIRAA